eukprot:TRINITY_DN496_c2_g1_i12.p1 TRINITY_DN496_c2_g1~~TRINITY_DN496_c2_g1_i12.p1  ORF type:complete len:101 (+),score=6.27 TRINITY_DN496_c2_g1_i12:87-389(+)
MSFFVFFFFFFFFFFLFSEQAKAISKRKIKKAPPFYMFLFVFSSYCIPSTGPKAKIEAKSIKFVKFCLSKIVPFLPLPIRKVAQNKKKKKKSTVKAVCAA